MLQLFITIILSNSKFSIHIRGSLIAQIMIDIFMPWKKYV